jgi:DNA modification methylase
MRRELHFGDNLEVLKDRTVFPDETVDLIYLDPPFNSNASYNMLFKDKKGSNAEASITAFDDTWHWGMSAETAFDDVVQSENIKASDLLRALRSFLGDNDMMAYLSMMAVRLIEMRRILKSTGSLYLHCDPTASHYLKLVLDSIFDVSNFRNEITWKRTTAHNDPGRYGKNTDIILFYSKGPKWTWNPQYVGYTESYLDRFSHKDADGRAWQDDNLTAKGLSGGGYTYEYKGITSYWRVPEDTMKRLDGENRLYFNSKGGIRLKRYLDESKGYAIQALWDDIPPINSQAKERLGYPTQKPLALLERLIAASSNPGDIILDPFCGCGTAVDAAEKLGRQWIGIDITHLSIDLIERRMKDRYPELKVKSAFKVLGVPQDFESAEKLARERPDQFEKWAVTRIPGARPFKIRGADSGIDGILLFKQDAKSHKRIILSVKGGKNIGPSMLRDLKGVMEREQDCAMGLFISLYDPTPAMKTEAVNAGFYEWGGRRLPKLQIVTAKDIFEGRMPVLPSSIDTGASYKTASIQPNNEIQGDLEV